MNEVGCAKREGSRSATMTFTLKIWRQNGPADKGRLVTYPVQDISPSMSFIEMLDVVNQQLTLKGEEPLAFEYDCREGICGSCSLVIDGVPHGPDRGTVCQLYMRRFPDGATITIEPWRAKAFPIIKDLVVDRSAFDRIMQAGGYVSVNTGGAVDGNVLLIGKDQAETAMDAASCISCGACVAACKNASATLFVAAKVSAQSPSACDSSRSSTGNFSEPPSKSRVPSRNSRRILTTNLTERTRPLPAGPAHGSSPTLRENWLAWLAVYASSLDRSGDIHYR
ncbi:MAG: sdhB [Nitrospira sp.]|nr:sdhB [Nitrospira sp.]